MKNKFIGLILIILGALPFLLKIKSLGDLFAEGKPLNYLAPGGIIYQIVIIALGVLLIWTFKPRVERAR